MTFGERFKVPEEYKEARDLGYADFPLCLLTKNGVEITGGDPKSLLTIIGDQGTNTDNRRLTYKGNPLKVLYPGDFFGVLECARLASNRKPLAKYSLIQELCPTEWHVYAGAKTSIVNLPKITTGDRWREIRTAAKSFGVNLESDPEKQTDPENSEKEVSSFIGDAERCFKLFSKVEKWCVEGLAFPNESMKKLESLVQREAMHVLESDMLNKRTLPTLIDDWRKSKQLPASEKKRIEPAFELIRSLPAIVMGIAPCRADVRTIRCDEELSRIGQLLPVKKARSFIERVEKETRVCCTILVPSYISGSANGLIYHVQSDLSGAWVKNNEDVKLVEDRIEDWLDKLKLDGWKAKIIRKGSNSDPKLHEWDARKHGGSEVKAAFGSPYSVQKSLLLKNSSI